MDAYTVATGTHEVDPGECYTVTGEASAEATYLGSCIGLAAYHDGEGVIAHLETLDNTRLTDQIDAFLDTARDYDDPDVFAGGTVPRNALMADTAPDTVDARRMAEEALGAAFEDPVVDWCSTFSYSRVTLDAENGIGYDEEWEP